MLPEQRRFRVRTASCQILPNARDTFLLQSNDNDNVKSSPKTLVNIGSQPIIIQGWSFDNPSEQSLGIIFASSPRTASFVSSLLVKRAERILYHQKTLFRKHVSQRIRRSCSFIDNYSAKLYIVLKLIPTRDYSSLNVSCWVSIS